MNAITDDRYGLGFLALDRPQHVEPVEVVGVRHTGDGELVSVDALGEDRLGRAELRLTYDIDGCSWVYVGRFEADARRFVVTRTLCGDSSSRRFSDKPCTANLVPT